MTAQFAKHTTRSSPHPKQHLDKKGYLQKKVRMKADRLYHQLDPVIGIRLSNSS
jgi:hypothetical protein